MRGVRQVSLGDISKGQVCKDGTGKVNEEQVIRGKDRYPGKFR